VHNKLVINLLSVLRLARQEVEARVAVHEGVVGEETVLGGSHYAHLEPARGEGLEKEGFYKFVIYF